MTKKNYIFNILVALAVTAVITYLFPHPEANHYKFEEGRPWNYSKLIAPFDIPIRPDSLTVQSVRDSLDRCFAPVFTRDNDAANSTITNMLAQWSQDEAEPQPLEKTLRQKAVAYIRSAYIADDIIDNDHADDIASGQLQQIRVIDGGVMSKADASSLATIAEVAEAMAPALSADTAMAAAWIAANGIEKAMVPNLAFDRETSNRLYQEDLNQLGVRMGAVNTGVILQGQTIIDKGAIVTSQDYTNLLTYEHMLDEQRSASHRSNWMMWVGQALYVMLIMMSLLTFLRFIAADVWRSRSAMLFTMLSVCVFFLMGVALDSAVDLGIYLVPFAIVPILMIVFFDAPTAIFTSLAIILLCAGVVAYPLEFIILQVMGSIAAVFSLKELSKRSQLLRTSLFVMASYLAGYVAIELMFNGSTAGLTWRMVIYLAVSSAMASMAYILMVAIERVFGFVSIVTLIELADTNNPLLRELSQECPGTFQHSIAVSNLASDAAIKIHANEQLVRAGALYHDIGKMTNPNFFTENQHSVNPHDSLPPEQSARIIIGHVTDGVKRAEKAGLPKVVKDFILQHHGKGKAKYFYFTYCNSHPGEEVDPAPFTYPGPNPTSRETSLLMMADSVEAASRSLKEHTPESISELVNKIIDAQIAEGLHNDSPLQFRDIAVIKQAFVRRLMTMYHSRIVYPDAPATN